MFLFYSFRSIGSSLARLVMDDKTMTAGLADVALLKHAKKAEAGAAHIS